MRSKNSLGKFPEHKLRAYLERLPWNPALTHSGEKDKRRKGAEDKSRVQAGKILTDAAFSPIAPKFEFVKIDHDHWEQLRHLRAFQCYWLRSSSRKTDFL